MLHHVCLWLYTSISEEHAASICISTMNMTVTCSSETLVYNNTTTQKTTIWPHTIMKMSNLTVPSFFVNITEWLHVTFNLKGTETKSEFTQETSITITCNANIDFVPYYGNCAKVWVKLMWHPSFHCPSENWWWHEMLCKIQMFCLWKVIHSWHISILYNKIQCQFYFKVSNLIRKILLNQWYKSMILWKQLYSTNYLHSQVIYKNPVIMLLHHWRLVIWKSITFITAELHVLYVLWCSSHGSKKTEINYWHEHFSNYFPSLPNQFWKLQSVHFLESTYTELYKKKYTLSKIYFTSTIEHMVTCYIQTEWRTLKVIFTPYKHPM
jgi:hypothetical protein